MPVIVVAAVAVTVPAVNPSIVLRSAAAAEVEVTVTSTEPDT